MRVLQFLTPARILIIQVLNNHSAIKRMMDGFRLRKEDLEIDWEALGEAENKLKKP